MIVTTICGNNDLRNNDLRNKVRLNKSPVKNYLPVTPARPVPGGVEEVLWLSA